MSLSTMLERLAEYFPKQDYQSRLEQYLVSKYPKSTADIEHWVSDFDRDQQQRGFIQ